MRYRLTTATTPEARVLLALVSARALWGAGGALELPLLACVADVTEREARIALAVALELCSCVECQVDAERGRNLVTARWPDGRYWACFRNLGVGDGTVSRREQATAFGPRHASKHNRDLRHDPVTSDEQSRLAPPMRGRTDGCAT